MLAEDDECAFSMVMVHCSYTPVTQHRVSAHVPDADMISWSQAGRILILGLQVEIVTFSIQCLDGFRTERGGPALKVLGDPGSGGIACEDQVDRVKPVICL